MAIYKFQIREDKDTNGINTVTTKQETENDLKRYNNASAIKYEVQITLEQRNAPAVI